MAGSFPTSVTTYTNPGPTDATATEIGGRSHDEFHADNNDDLEQVMTKLGTGSSTASADTVLRGTGTGTTTFGQIQTADIADSAITGIKLAANQIQSGHIVDGTLVNADINSAAAIALTKIAHVGTGNILRSNGTTNVAGQIVSGDITDGTIATADLTSGAVSQGPAVTTGSTNPTLNSATPTLLADPTASITTLSGSDIDVHARMTVSSTGADGVNFYVRIDGGGWVFIGDVYPIASGGRPQVSGFHRFASVSAATHTIEMGWANIGGGITATSYAVGRKLMVLERKR